MISSLAHVYCCIHCTCTFTLMRTCINHIFSFSLFLISHFLFPISRFLIPLYTNTQSEGSAALLVSCNKPHPLQAGGESLVKSLHTSHVNCPGFWQKWFKPIRLQYVDLLTWQILYASVYAYRDPCFSASTLVEHHCWLARRLKWLWWLVLKGWDLEMFTTNRKMLSYHL